MELSSEKKKAKTGGKAKIPISRNISAKKRINVCLNVNIIRKLLNNRCVDGSCFDLTYN
jgi:hypothetical protein